MSRMLRCVRTTLTLDDDVAERLERLRSQRRATLKEVVNEALREGMERMESPRPRQRFRTRAVDHGGLLVNLDSVADALTAAEGDLRR